MKNLYNPLLIFSMAAMLFGSAYADTPQTGSIFGRIYSSNTGDSVPYASVRVTGTDMGSVSNENGEYFIMNIPPGEYELKITLMGYEDIVKHIVVADSSMVNMDIYMMEVPLPMAGIEVNARRDAHNDIDIFNRGRRLNPGIIGARPGMVDDLLRQVQEMPEVKARSDFSSKMYIRGSGPEHNIIFIDGVPTYYPYRSFGVYSSFNPNLVENVNLFAGGFPAEYGGRLSAVLDIKYRDGNTKKFRPSFDLNALAAGVSLEGPIDSDHCSYIFSARRTYYDILLKHSSEKTAYPHFYDIYGKLSFGRNSNDFFNLSCWHNGEGFRITQDKDPGDNRSYYARAQNSGSAVGIQGNWRHLEGPLLLIEHTIYSILETRNLDMTGDIGARYKSDFDETAVKGKATYCGNSSQFSIGYIGAVGHERVEWDGYNFPDSLDEERPPDSPDIRPIQEHFHFNQPYTSWAAFVSSDINLSDRWVLSNGYRLSGGGLIDRISLSPRWGLSCNLSDYLILAYSGGIYYQPPTFKACLEKNYLPELWRNPGINPEKALHNIIDLKYNAETRWKMELSLYHKELDDLIYDDPPNSTYPANCGSGAVYGLELTLVRSGDDRLNGNIYYSLSETRLRTPIGNYHPNYDQRHSLSTGLDCMISSHWKASAGFRYGSGFPYTEIVDRKRGTDSELTPWIPVWGEVNAARYPYYSRLDLRLTYRFDWANSRWEVYVEGLNVLNRKNVYAYTYDREYLIRSTINQLPFLPNFGLSVKF